MTLDYNQLRKEFIEKQRQLDREKMAKRTAKAFNKARQQRGR